MSAFWTEDRVDELKRRLAAGESDGKIAKAWDVTRNTIIGKRQRLGIYGKALAKKPRQSHDLQHITPIPVAPPAPPKPPKPKLVVNNDKAKALPPVLKRSRFTNDVVRGCSTPARPVNMDRLPGDPEPIGKPGEFEGCRWIAETPTAEAICCGREQMDGSSYCPTHDQRTRSHPTSFRSAEQIESFARFVR